MDTNKDFKGIWIPKEIWLSKELTPLEKMYLAVINSLNVEENGCYATNKYFGEVFQHSTNNVSRMITNLKNKGWITVEYEYLGQEIQKRIIKIVRYYQDELGVLSKQTNGCYQNGLKVLSGETKGYYQDGLKGGIKSSEEIINRDNIRDNKDNIYSDQNKRFSKPTIEELEFYCKENSLKVDCNYFYDYYESNGWTVGKSKMKDWKATLRNWNRRNLKEENPDEIVSTEIINGVKYGISKKGDRWSMGVVNE